MTINEDKVLPRDELIEAYGTVLEAMHKDEKRIQKFLYRLRHEETDRIQIIEEEGMGEPFALEEML